MPRRRSRCARCSWAAAPSRPTSSPGPPGRMAGRPHLRPVGDGVRRRPRSHRGGMGQARVRGRAAPRRPPDPRGPGRGRGGRDRHRIGVPLLRVPGRGRRPGARRRARSAPATWAASIGWAPDRRRSPGRPHRPRRREHQPGRGRGRARDAPRDRGGVRRRHPRRGHGARRAGRDRPASRAPTIPATPLHRPRPRDSSPGSRSRRASSASTPCHAPRGASFAATRSARCSPASVTASSRGPAATPSAGA